jgi:predicted dehydrogenase
MAELRIGVIGTGMMGCEHLRNLIGIANVAVTAISDPHEEQQGWARHTLGNHASGVAEFTDHRDLLSSGLVDAVLVAAPNFNNTTSRPRK